MKFQAILLISFCAVASATCTAVPFDGWGMGDGWPYPRKSSKVAALLGG